MYLSTLAISTFYPSHATTTAHAPAYRLSKDAGTLAFSLIAKDVSPDEHQAVAFHPGSLNGKPWQEAGVHKTRLLFDDSRVFAPIFFSSGIDFAFSVISGCICCLGCLEGGSVRAREVPFGGMGR